VQQNPEAAEGNPKLALNQKLGEQKPVEPPGKLNIDAPDVKDSVQNEVKHPSAPPTKAPKVNPAAGKLKPGSKQVDTVS
jgi:hypothetical protein